MSYVQPTPPLRDLPQGRLALRSQHLRAELVRKPERTHRRRTALVLVAAAVLLGATLLATPALGLRDAPGHTDEDEFVEVVPMLLADAIAAVGTGEIQDMKTIAGLMMAARHLKRPGG